MYDVIVVGARCAGSPTAMLLARKGYRVLLVDKATFPSDTISGHYIHQPGIALLKRWGLLDRVVATGCPPVRSFTADFGDGLVLSGSPPPAGDVYDAYAPRRTVLDKILVDAAAEAGAEVREGFSVRELTTDNGIVTGIRGLAKGAALVTERARIVIGADGFRSSVARTVEAPSYNARPTLSFGYASYWSGVPLDGFALYDLDWAVIGAFPTNEGLTLIFTQQRIERFLAFRADLGGNFYRTLDNKPELAQRVRNGRREERWFGVADMPNFYRKPYGPGWALVGDAGYHKDPITGEGMTDAFRDAKLLTDAIDDGFSHRRPLLEALAAYERQRNEATLPLYEFTCQRAAFEPRPQFLTDLLRSLQGNQEATDRFFGIIPGTTPFAEFMSPENVQSILAKAA
jgi:flavin-dependent dehydrogenase